MRCYMLCITSGSSLDKNTNNYSLFNVVEQCQLKSFPAQAPFETHIWFEVESVERGERFELELLIKQGDEVLRRSNTWDIFPDSERYRVRINGLDIPQAGRCKVTARFRPKGEGDWQNVGLEWPLHAEEVEKSKDVGSDS